MAQRGELLSRGSRAGCTGPGRRCGRTTTARARARRCGWSRRASAPWPRGPSSPRRTAPASAGPRARRRRTRRAFASGTPPPFGSSPHGSPNRAWVSCEVPMDRTSRWPDAASCRVHCRNSRTASSRSGRYGPMWARVRGRLPVRAAWSRRRDEGVGRRAEVRVARAVRRAHPEVVGTADDLLAEAHPVTVVRERLPRLLRHHGLPDAEPGQGLGGSLLAVEAGGDPGHALPREAARFGQPGEVEGSDRPALPGEELAPLELPDQPVEQGDPVTGIQPVAEPEPGDALPADPALDGIRFGTTLGPVRGLADLVGGDQGRAPALDEQLGDGGDAEHVSVDARLQDPETIGRAPRIRHAAPLPVRCCLCARRKSYGGRFAGVKGPRKSPATRKACANSNNPVGTHRRLASSTLILAPCPPVP